MLDFDPVGLARLQFAVTALYHFLFVPLTLGLSFLLAVMESVYVMTGREIWRDATKFWGKLFGINFAMGVATGITMEFQFGTNWAYYSHYVGDIFGAPLAIEGLMAFFLESTFVGLFFFGWDRLSKPGHLVVTWLVAIGSNLSAVWILIANGWIHPTDSSVNVAIGQGSSAPPQGLQILRGQGRSRRLQGCPSASELRHRAWEDHSPAHLGELRAPSAPTDARHQTCADGGLGPVRVNGLRPEPR